MKQQDYYFMKFEDEGKERYREGQRKILFRESEAMNSEKADWRDEGGDLDNEVPGEVQ